MNPRVSPVRTRRERRLFRDLPIRLHGRDPAFVPMLDAALAALLDRKRNPFWKQARGREWLCWRGAEAVGRIGACRDEALSAREHGCGAVGLFAAAEPAVAQTLLREAEGWLAAQGCTRLRGPLNYSIHDTAGLLVEGFDTPPTVDTTWNPPCYDGFWQRAGWRPVQEMIGAAGALEFLGPERARRFARRARRRGVTVRPLDGAHFDREIERIRAVYNSAWDSNWGHVPISAAEFAFKAKDMKAVLDPDLVRLAEQDGELVGLFLGLPDLNVAIKRSRGRLLPFGWWRLLRAKRAGGRVRVLLLGVVEGYRNRGIEALLMSDSFAAIGKRYPWCEASWVLADNAAMANGLALYNLYPYKRWRMYERPAGDGRLE